MSSPGKTLASSYLILSAFMLGFGVRLGHLGGVFDSWSACDFLSPRAFDFYNLETSDAEYTAGCWFHDQVPEMAAKGAGLLPWVPPLFSPWMPFNYERCCGCQPVPQKPHVAPGSGPPGRQREATSVLVPNGATWPLMRARAPQ